MKNIDVKEIIAVMDELEKERGISKDYLVAALEEALVKAYKQNFDADENVENVKVTIDKVTGEMHVYSAHRTPIQAADFSKNARENGFGAIIAFAGKAAHLAGALAANTTLPVIGVPVKSSTLDGLDALLATVQMPSGIPVATVAIDGAQNAALLACQMLSIEDEEAAKKLQDKRDADAKKVLEKDAAISANY